MKRQPSQPSATKELAEKCGISENEITRAMHREPVPPTTAEAIAQKLNISTAAFNTAAAIPEQQTQTAQAAPTGSRQTPGQPEAEGKHEPTFTESEVERIIHRILKHVIAEAVAIVKDPEDFLDLVNTISYLWNYDSIEFGKDKQYKAIKTIEEK